MVLHRPVELAALIQDLSQIVDGKRVPKTMMQACGRIRRKRDGPGVRHATSTTTSGTSFQQCGTVRPYAFVLHGLWPQASSGPPPMSCSNASPVAADTVDHMLNFMPTRSLIQHEWQKHGTCTGLSAQDYFAKVEQAFKQVHVPDQYRNLNREQQFSVPDIEKRFADANSAPPQAFRISCHAGDLIGVEVCVDKKLQYRTCTQNVRECPVSNVEMRPPQ